MFAAMLDLDTSALRQCIFYEFNRMSNAHSGESLGLRFIFRNAVPYVKWIFGTAASGQGIGKGWPAITGRHFFL
jgi:hypothetical protein